jgi:hypothetical protein
MTKITPSTPSSYGATGPSFREVLSLEPPYRLEVWRGKDGLSLPISQVAYSLGLLSLTKLPLATMDIQELDETIEKLRLSQKVSSEVLLQVTGLLGVGGPVFSIVKALKNFR